MSVPPKIDQAESMLEYVARSNERLADVLQRLADLAASDPSVDARRELDELVAEARALLKQHAADRPALDKRLARSRENRVKPRPPKDGDK